MPSYNLLGPTNLVEQPDFVGDPVRAAGWYGLPEGLHTVAIYTRNFTGRVFIEGSLSMDPNCCDWFPIKLSQCQYIEYPKNPLAIQSPYDGDTMVDGYTFRSNVLWLRARVWRSYFLTNPLNPSEIDTLGSISKIVVGF